MSGRHFIDAPELSSAGSIVAGRHWSRCDDGRLRCDVCPRECRLAEGQRGLCFVRARHGDQIVLTTWGRSSGYCIDPIEKKPLDHFLPGTPVLSFGTAGCNLTCSFCQNWDISKSREMDTLADRATPETIARAAEALGCRSVAFTYNDPVIFLEYAVDAAQACRDRGIKTVAVTAGYVKPDARREFFASIDAANVDLKGFTERFYQKLCTGHLEPVLDTLEVPEAGDAGLARDHDLADPGRERLRRGDPRRERVDRREPRRRRPVALQRLPPRLPHARQARDAGRRRCAARARSRAATASDTSTPATCTTRRDRAPSATRAGHALIGRDWYDLGEWNLDAQGRCAKCQTRVRGRLRGAPGHLGRTPRPVRLADFA